jgi:predicted DNA-binding transcriptional regulator YafY
MRVYINSLKRIGCEIKRVKGEDKISRYTITSHPFELNFTPEELQSAIKVYKNLVKNMDIKDIIYMDKFFEKVGKYIKNEDFISTLKNLSMLKGINRDLLEELIDCCEQKLKVTVNYNSPNSGAKDIEFVANEIIILNNKIYINAYGMEYEHTNNFLISRINQIKNKEYSYNITDFKKEVVTYEVYTSDKYFDLAEYESIIKKEDNKITIKAETSNIFFLKQRLLQFGPKCKILAPESFKKDFINLLQDMKAGYCD